VVLAADLEEACRLWARNGSLQTIVTPAGHVVSHQGFLVGGSPDKLSGILAKKQELKALERQVARQDQELAAARAQQETLETEVRRIESSLQKRIEHRNGIGHNEIEAEKSLVKASEERKHAERMLEIVRLEQEQLQGEESDIDAQIVAYSKSLAELEKEVRASQERVATTAARIHSVAEQMESANQRVVDLQLTCTSLEARFENSTNSLRRLKAFQADGVQRIEQLIGEIRQKTHKRTAAAEKITLDEQKLAGLYTAQTGLEETLEYNETVFQKLEARLKESDDDKSRLQSLREKTNENIRLVELEVSQQRLQRENIAQRIEERYHRPFPELKAQMRDVLENNRRDMAEIEQALAGCRKKIERIGEVNLGAIAEYEQLKTRFDFLTSQRDDLVKAIDDLHKVIRKINRITQERFMQTFTQVNDKLNEVFPRLFEGGTAKLVLTEPDKPLETGIELMIHPPGKKLTRLSLLSGGEKALSAIAFIFSIFLIRPAAFCLMDEIDAPLDDANVHRFNDLLKIIGQNSQVIMITHNKRSMEFADMLFGITMEKKGISKVVSVNLQRQEG
jgi:chromosome segregation protein